MSGIIQSERSIKRLMLLAGELRDALALGEWEHAVPVQIEYDEAFASFQSTVGVGAALPHALLGDLERLAQVHDENVKLARQLRSSAGAELDKTTTISRIGQYAPLGANEPGIASRFVDGAA